MATPVLIVGHKHPDNDSIAGAVCYAYLKNQLMKRELEKNPDAEELVYQPACLGPLPDESRAIIEEFGLEAPVQIDNVSARVRDVMTSPVITVPASAKLLEAGRLLSKHNVRALVVTDAEGKYDGLITSRLISERYIAAMDEESHQSPDQVQAVAEDLVSSLTQEVSSLTDHDVLVVEPDDLLKDITDDLLASTLREAVVLGSDGTAVGIITRSDVAVRPQRKVILVDHNERAQAVDGLDEAEVLEIVDHHRIGDVSTANPIRFLNFPWGSTATIITAQFRQEGIEIPKGIAALLLSAIMTDTVILKSPTATDVDREQVEYLAGIVGEDPTEFGLRVFRCRRGDADMAVEKLVCADSKEFQLASGTILIAQRETVNLQGVMDREEEIREFLRKLQEENSYQFVLLLVTDIFAEGSNFLVEGDRSIVDKVFGIDSSASVWMPGVMSRKKQVAAPLLNA